MDNLSILPILKKIPLFKELKEETHRVIIDHIILEYFPANTIIFNEGDKGDKMSIIKKGLVKVFRTKNTSETELAILGENEFFGEMALICDEPRSASVITLEECELFALYKNDFINLCQSIQEMASLINDEFIRRIKANQRLEI